jgi:alkanesulfonate monooxygenase SsuD/methylene tetrahydromethanopterin reductase-like flavin-dependent oxidoreductase (luciferase family)
VAPVSGPRIALALPGSDGAAVLAAARAAETWNLDCIVVGDLTGTAINSDDTYVLTAAAAVATATAHLRICLALDLRGSAPLLRVAEDLGVLDVMSAGRIELLMRVAAEPRWRRDLDAVLGAWLGWPLPGGSTIPVSPAPLQAAIPTWLVEGSSAVELRGGPGMVVVDWPDRIPEADWLTQVRRRRDEAGAATVVLDAGTVPPDQRDEVIRALGTVVGPCLRCPADEVAILAPDSTEYLLHRKDLHEPPTAGGQ